MYLYKYVVYAWYMRSICVIYTWYIYLHLIWTLSKPYLNTYRKADNSQGKALNDELISFESAFALLAGIFSFKKSTVSVYIESHARFSFSDQSIFVYLCTSIGSLFRRIRKAIKRECREIRQQSRCCKLRDILNNTFATVGFSGQWEGVQKRSKSEDLPCSFSFLSFRGQS